MVAGRYKLVRRIAEGGMGSVYEGEQALGSSQRAVAVKLLRPEFSQDPSVKARFEREAATVARLEHFNTVRVYDYGTADDGTLFIAMEYVQGRSLQSVLDESGPLAAERVVRIASQIAASLEEAHGLGIVHRDLKPDNILLIESHGSERDVVKLVDFGIAKGQPSGGSATTKLTELGTFVGTPAYMSPEQFSSGSVSPRSDIYSLGITVYQMLAGRLPFEAQSILDWARAHLEVAPTPLAADHGAGPIPEHMRRAVLRALSKDASARQISAAQLASELAGHGATGDTQAAADGPAPLVVAAPMAPPASVQPGPLKTAPMTQLPDVARSGGPATTQPMAQLPAVSPVRAAGVPLAPTLPPGYGTRRRSRGWLWAALFVIAGGAALFALTLLRITPWQLALRPEPAPPPLLVPSPEVPTAPTPAPPEPAPAPTATEREDEKTRPPPARSSPAPSQPGTPAPSTPPSAAPNAPAGVPPIQLPPGVPLPGPQAPAPSNPGTAPATPPALPQLPWSLPTAGACERCIAALNGSGNYIIVSAVAEGVLCEDRAARETCERQIAEMAPAVAERAARSGDCPAALATAAAALNVRVSPDKFAIVNTLCLR
jgi:serine/threonine-protein kinase